MTVNINDFSSQQTFDFSTKPENQVSVVEYSIKGEVNGRVEIYGLNNDQHFVSGKIDSTFRVDYFTNKAFFVVNPLAETKGNLQIRLGFY